MNLKPMLACTALAGSIACGPAAAQITGRPDAETAPGSASAPVPAPTPLRQPMLPTTQGSCEGELRPDRAVISVVAHGESLKAVEANAKVEAALKQLQPHVAGCGGRVVLREQLRRTRAPHAAPSLKMLQCGLRLKAPAVLLAAAGA